MLSRRSFRACILICVGMLSLVGCAPDNPGQWPAEKVAQKVSESLEATDVVLEPSGSGFTGQGKRADGETLTIVITAEPDKRQFSWDVKGDRGFVETGYFGK